MALFFESVRAEIFPTFSRLQMMVSPSHKTVLRRQERRTPCGSSSRHPVNLVSLTPRGPALRLQIPGGANANVNVALTDLNGVGAGSTSMTIPAGGQVAMFLHEIPSFSNLATPFEGILRITTTSPAGVSAIGLRGLYNERHDFLIATMPYIDEEGPSSGSEKVFPHIVNGDGYTTQFILMSRTATTGEVRFISQSGEPLP